MAGRHGSRRRLENGGPRTYTTSPHAWVRCRDRRRRRRAWPRQHPDGRRRAAVRPRRTRRWRAVAGRRHAAAGACARHPAPPRDAAACPAWTCWNCSPSCVPARPVPPDPARPGPGAGRADPPDGMEDACLPLLPGLVAALLARLAAGRDTPANRRRRRHLAARMGQAGWGWALTSQSALGRARVAKPERRACACGSACRNGRSKRRRPRPPSSPRGTRRKRARRLAAMLGPARRAAPGPGRLRLRRRRRLRPAGARGDPACRAGRGRHRHRQDARLHRPRQPVGRAQRRPRVDQHLHPPPATPDRRRTGACIPTRRSGGARVVVRKGRENYLCLLNLEDRGERRWPAPAAATVVIPLGLMARWALATADGDIAGRRPAGLVRRVVRPGGCCPPRGPPRRVHPWRLPALQAAASWSTPSAAPAPPTWWWRTTPW